MAGISLRKICHVTTVDLSVRFLLLNQVRYLKDEGMTVHVACSNGDWLPQIEREGFPVHRVEMKRSLAPISDLFALRSLVDLFRRERFDLVHVHTPKASLLGALAARLAGISKVVYTIHGFYFHEGMARSRRAFYLFWEKVIARFVDAALSQNRADLETAVREGLYREGEIEFLGNGIDLSRFDPRLIPDEKRVEMRKAVGIPAGCPVVGIVARLVREKGFLELFRAIGILKGEFPEIRLLAVGPWDKQKGDALSPDTARDMGIGDRVVFTGMRLDVAELYAIMDLFVLPSYREGYPRGVMEASAMGLPVVASDVRGCREAVADGQTGILVPVRDPDRLAAAIATILRDRPLAVAMGAAGRRKALDDFDERNVFRKVLRTYRALDGSRS